MEPKNLGLLRQVCLPCQEEEKEEDCILELGEDKILLLLQRTKNKPLVSSQKTKDESLVLSQQLWEDKSRRTKI